MAESAAMAQPTPRRRGPAGEVWSQQPGENDLWYARFARFVALGPSRSVSLVATGRRNAYPVPAHWPIQAKQRSWRERAKAFDAAAREDLAIVAAFNAKLVELASSAPNGEASALAAAVSAGGYQAPPDDEYEDDAGLSR